MVRRDDAAERPPGIGVRAEPAPQLVGLVAVDEVELEGELFPHLVLPLQAQRSRCQDEDALDSPADEQLAQDEAGFDGLAEAHVIGDEQAHARHLQRLEQGNELKILDLNRAVKGR